MISRSHDDPPTMSYMHNPLFNDVGFKQIWSRMIPLPSSFQLTAAVPYSCYRTNTIVFPHHQWSMTLQRLETICAQLPIRSTVPQKRTATTITYIPSPSPSSPPPPRWISSSGAPFRDDMKNQPNQSVVHNDEIHLLSCTDHYRYRYRSLVSVSSSPRSAASCEDSGTVTELEDASMVGEWLHESSLPHSFPIDNGHRHRELILLSVTSTSLPLDTRQLESLSTSILMNGFIFRCGLNDHPPHDFVCDLFVPICNNIMDLTVTMDNRKTTGGEWISLSTINILHLRDKGYGVVIPGRSILIMGGHIGHNWVASIDRFCLVTLKWCTTPWHLPERFYIHGLEWHVEYINGYGIYIMGSLSISSSDALQIWRLDIDNDGDDAIWQRVSSPPIKPTSHRHIPDTLLSFTW
jgi:hypothetical protein